MTTTVVDSPDTSRFELVIDGETAGYATYEINGNSIAFTHTVVDPDRRENGLGTRLVTDALDRVRSGTSYRVVAVCPFVADFMEKNPSYQDLLER